MLASLSLTSMKIVSWSLLYLTSGSEFKSLRNDVENPGTFQLDQFMGGIHHKNLWEDMSVCVWDIGKGPFVVGLVNAAICG